MATQAQILANRLNAQRSTGPKTPQGKALASKNSLKHGLSARCDVITTESQEEFDHHRDALLNELDPQTPMESMLADRIISLSWRLKRADLIQNQTIDVLTEKDAANPLANLAKSLGLKGLGLLQPDPADSNPDLILGRIALKDFSNERVLDRLLMYERRIEHSLFKTLLELQRLRLLRTLESMEPNLEPEHPHLAPGTAWGPSPKSPENPVSPFIRPDPIINNKSSIVTIENPPTLPFSRRRHLSRGDLSHRDDDDLTPNSTSRQQDNIHPPQGANTQNEPNFQNPKTATTSYAPKSCNNTPLHPTQKNEPNRTQTRQARSVSAGVPHTEQQARSVSPSLRGLSLRGAGVPYTEQQARSVSAGVYTNPGFPLADTAKTTTIAHVAKPGSGPDRNEQQRKRYFKENVKQ